MDEDQDAYRAAAERAAHGIPASRPVAVAYALAMLVLATALLVSGRA
ncbi:hypothetical protein [Kitasatospora griseola]